MTTIPPAWFLVLAIALFCIGLYAALARRGAVAVLMGIAVMFDAVIVSLAVFWRHTNPAGMSAPAFALAVAATAAAEIALGSALVVALRRRHGAATLDDMDTLKE